MTWMMMLRFSSLFTTCVSEEIFSILYWVTLRLSASCVSLNDTHCLSVLRSSFRVCASLKASSSLVACVSLVALSSSDTCWLRVNRNRPVGLVVEHKKEKTQVVTYGTNTSVPSSKVVTYAEVYWRMLTYVRPGTWFTPSLLCVSNR